MGWTEVIFLVGATCLVVGSYVTYLRLKVLRKRRAAEKKRQELIRMEEKRDWHTGKHFGTVFYNPDFRCDCVVVKVENRDRWLFVSRKEPEKVRMSRRPITTIVGERI